MRLLCDFPTFFKVTRIIQDNFYILMKDLSAPVRGSVTIWVSAGPEQCVVVRVLSCQLSPGAAAVVMMQGTGWCRNAEVPPHFALWDSVCRSPEGLMYLSQTPTVRWLWSHPRVVGNNIL